MKKVLLPTPFAALNYAVVVFGQDNQSVLWEISGKELAKPSYLLSIALNTKHLESGKYHISGNRPGRC